MKCRAIACETHASIREYCTKCYLRRRRHGHYGRIDATPVRKHILKLRKLGWTLRQIDDASGCKVASYIASGRTRMVLHETAAKILAVKPIPQSRQLSGVGFRRRAEALAWMGWSQAEVAKRTGLSAAGIISSSKRDIVASRVFGKMRDFYDRFKDIEGPSRLAATRARTAGYAPPVAWDYADIDDPKARPFQGFNEKEAA